MQKIHFELDFCGVFSLIILCHFFAVSGQQNRSWDRSGVATGRVRKSKDLFVRLLVHGNEEEKV